MLKHAALLQLTIIIRFILFLTPISTLTGSRSQMDKKVECLFCIEKSNSLDNNVYDGYSIKEDDSCDANEYVNKYQARETIIHMLTVGKVPSDKIFITTLDPDSVIFGILMPDLPTQWIGSNFHLWSDSMCTDYMNELSPINIYTEINKRKQNTDMITDWFLRTESESTADLQMSNIAQQKAQLFENLAIEGFVRVSSVSKLGDSPSETSEIYGVKYIIHDQHTIAYTATHQDKQSNTYSSKRDKHTINKILSKDIIKHKITSFVGPTATNQDNDATSDKATNCGCSVWDCLKCC
eukprot:149771_1